MNFQTHCDRYLQRINRTRTIVEATPELSLHTHLQTFLEEIVVDCFNKPNITFIHEPKKVRQIGQPDFITLEESRPIGYIEAEEYDINLNKLTGHAKKQNERFKKNLRNFVLTNFLDFQLWRDGQLRAKANITDSPENLKSLLEQFLNAGHVQITSPESLAKHLAKGTRELKEQITTTLTDENSEIYGMFSAFKEVLISTLTKSNFADIYAQTLSYGLFAARYTLPNGTEFSRYTAAEALPKSNPFLKELFYRVASPTLEKNVTYILDDITTLLRNIPTGILRTVFDTKTHFEDPVIHFYETFLKEYDPDLRFELGVFYTPPQVISYIVRSVDSLLKTELNRPDGLADDGTLILDPATGTGGFLLAVLDHVQKYVTKNYGTGEWTQYVNAELVRRFFGFELLVAPYTIAHLKLSLFLQAQDWRADERLRIYLTNTLEQPEEKQESLPFAGFISDEANAALSVKRDEPILVILGNPPYPQDSANPSRVGRELTFIGELIEDYKPTDGKLLGIKDQTKFLQADYVKFIRWAQWRIDRNGEGVIGYIVNNTFLKGVTFRKMRQSLMKSFNAIYCFNLHGGSRIGEIVPDGETDENVFDIQQGTTILLCVKERDNVAPAKIYYADLWGSRKKKERILSETNIQTDCQVLHATSPFYRFSRQHITPEQEAIYMQGWQVNDIFHESSIGILTARDKLTIHRSAEKALKTIADFASLPEDEARKKYKLPKDSQDWKVHLAQADLRHHPDTEQHIQPIHYRPFDTRWTYYTGQSRGFHCAPRPAIMPHLLKENFALCTHRSLRSAITWQHILIVDRIIDGNCISTKDGPTHVFPLYLYPNPEELGISTERSLNFKPAFLTELSEALELPQTAPFNLPEGVSPEEILAYIYAVLYSPTYRKRYYEFLEYGFPRIPLPLDIDQFRILAALGQRLIDSHLLKDVPRPEGTSVLHRFEGEGNGVVLKSEVCYRDGNVWINATQYFADVPEEVWKYEIGAYQVCEKWLKDRRGEVLSHAEVRQYRAILVAIAETLSVIAEIDPVLWSAV